MIPAWFPSLILFSVPMTLLGYAFGRLHIRYLAFHGGESKYPEPIPETVEAYRELNHVEELQRTFYGVMAVPLVATAALSAATVVLLIGSFGVGYYFATLSIRELVGVERADEQRIFNDDSLEPIAEPSRSEDGNGIGSSRDDETDE
ncbi:hypothetical protein [Halorubrum vacuolatum]|uniref:Uncharacterized protein n=1 Tax=Halorubrum vacuolatum TaxID=63740 RepID=A0A238WAW6_HALVU|nr:hypothetical protein [Halorubrum vacuolatum]SNR43353.1 hypothetical protein SAMN06264855_10687 [Halorubrum vacuolatum]